MNTDIKSFQGFYYIYDRQNKEVILTFNFQVKEEWKVKDKRHCISMKKIK